MSKDIKEKNKSKTKVKKNVAAPKKRGRKAKYDWSKIRDDWQYNGLNPAQIHEKYGVHKNLIYKNIDKWTAENIIPDEPEIGEVVDSDAVVVMWKKLDKTGLTEKQKLFVIHYCLTNNLELAVKRAGYQKYGKYLKMHGYRLLNMPHVAEAIVAIRGICREHHNVTENDIVGHYAKLMKADIGDFLDYGIKTVTKYSKSGDPYDVEVPYVMLKSKDEIDTSLIKTIKLGKGGDFQIELFDKKQALSFFCRYMDIFGEKTDATTENQNKLAQGLIAMANGIMKKNPYDEMDKED